MLNMFEIKYDRWMLEWEYIGEGDQEEYNEEDPDDTPYYRATLFYTPDLPVVPTSKYFSVERGSYCTYTPTSTPVKVIQMLSSLLFHALPEKLDLDESEEHYENEGVSLPSRVMERWLWTTDPGRPTEGWNDPGY